MSVAVRSNPRPAPSSANDDIVLDARMSMAPTNADRLGAPPQDSLERNHRPNVFFLTDSAPVPLPERAPHVATAPSQGAQA